MDLYVLLAVIIISQAVMNLIDPKRTLRIHAHLLNLPASMERMALLTALGLIPLVLPLLLSLKGFLPVFLALLSIGLVSLLSAGSRLALVTFPLSLVFIPAGCGDLRAQSFVALTVPYLIHGFKWLITGMPARITFRGFEINLRYVVPLMGVVYAFDTAYPGEMSVFISDGSVIFLNPDFEPLHYVGFMAFTIVSISLPYMAVYGMRNGESSVDYLRAMVGSPIIRRTAGFALAMAVAIPVSLSLTFLNHLSISMENAIKFGVLGALSNVALPSGSDSRLTGYSYLSYLVLVHLLPDVPLYVVVSLGFFVSVSLYDIDAWRKRI
ncbi:hypothetical protein [Thermococcus sp. P6]|uniref:hypothetical protein n=1 Tax=Thermococcus sp. P6 TaxID=122420 RepID=UPI0012FE1469|nr:hypothetical protein [Thermococcus sp. P6]